MVYRYIFAVLVGAVSAMSISALHKRETDPVRSLPGYREGKDVRNGSILKNPYWGHLAFLFIGYLLIQKTRQNTIRLFWTTIMEYLVVISLYCLLLLLLLPVLRRTISSRVCVDCGMSRSSWQVYCSIWKRSKHLGMRSFPR